MIVGNEVALHYDTLKFARRVFELVMRYDLIPGFVAPSQPSVDEVIPVLPRSNVPGVVSLRGRYLLEGTAGAFGQQVDKWPFSQSTEE
ncbi:MAG: hypothetical protein WA183_07815 [Chthoniobacterales bacterium]